MRRFNVTPSTLTALYVDNFSFHSYFFKLQKKCCVFLLLFCAFVVCFIRFFNCFCLFARARVCVFVLRISILCSKKYITVFHRPKRKLGEKIARTRGRLSNQIKTAAQKYKRYCRYVSVVRYYLSYLRFFKNKLISISKYGVEIKLLKFNKKIFLQYWYNSRTEATVTRTFGNVSFFL